MSVLRIYLFGKFNMRHGEQVLAGFDAHKAQELFCYLLIYRDCPHPREALADLLWGGSSTTQSKKYLRKTLWQLQAALDSQIGPCGGRVLLVEPDWIQLNPKADLWLDVAVFERAFTCLQGVPGRELDSQSAQTLQSAVDLYRGELLENWYQDWCLCERERLQNIYRAILDKLIGYCETRRNYETGLVCAAHILRCDRARERTHRQLMRLHYLAGDRTTALRQYERCVAILKEELGVTPTKRTVALYEQIRSDQLDGSVRAPAQTTALDATIATLPKILDRLNQLHAALVNAQRQT
jgi:DNA-binding SARP family transcriptional activator